MTVNLGLAMRWLRDLFKFVMIRRWLNTGILRSSAICVLFQLFFLIQVVQIHEAFKVFVKEQIRLKFEAFEGEVKRSKVRSYMNWWIKCISAVIVKTASRNVAFKATRMRDSIMDGQDKFIMRESDNAEAGAREDCDEDLLDVGCNVDLYVANHESAERLAL